MKKFAFILFLIFTSACELIVDVDIPFDHAELTLNSFFSPDSLWAVDLSLNRHILNDTLFEKIDNGVVVIYRDGVSIDTLHHQYNGLYKSDVGKPLIGVEYEIRAGAEKYETGSGKSKIPSPVSIDHVEVTKGDDVPGGSQNNYIHITFTDDGAENYYHLIVERESEQYNYVTETIQIRRNRIPLDSEDPAIPNDNFNGEGFLIKDILFNGKEITLSFKMPYNDLSFASAAIISLHTVSEDYYQYKSTVQLQRETSGDPFAQPVNIHNNIVNGFGIFAGFSSSTFRYGSRPKPVITAITPLKGKPGDHVVISGENFTYQTNNPVGVTFKGLYHGEYANTVRQSDTELEVIIPERAISGKIVINAGGRVAVSETDFEVTN